MTLWSGRFSKEENSSANEFNSSIKVDKDLYYHDIKGSVAHTKMLAKQNIISMEEAEKIIDGLDEILSEIENGEIAFRGSEEDIHMAIEEMLIKRIGETGKKLHTARSRNDQIAVDIRMYLIEKIAEIDKSINKFITLLLVMADKNKKTIMPGYTHLQRAQPVTFAYHLLAYCQMFQRDKERFLDCKKRIQILPLGSGAVAGTTYNTDRDFLAKELGFTNISENAMDAVSDRDFAIEFASDSSICMMHLSRLCEELVLWSTSEFAFIEISDEFSTGSSIMPQKKNPDIAELSRGKTGRVYGNLMALLTIMKGLPLAYNKDMQETVPAVIDTAETILSCFSIMMELLESMEIKKNNMVKATQKGYLNATDAADYLVSKGLPFRECHEIIGKIVLECIKRDTAIENLTLEQLQKFSEKFEADVYQKIQIENCIDAKKSYGGASIENVERMIKQTKSKLK